MALPSLLRTPRLAASASGAVALMLAPAALAHSGHPHDGRTTPIVYRSLAGAATVLEGTLDVRHGDDFANGRARYQSFLRTSHGWQRLGILGRHPEELNGQRVQVTGSRRGGLLDVARIERAKSPAARRLQAALTLNGPTKVAVILVTFSDLTTAPYLAAAAHGVVFSNASASAAYFQELTHGSVTMTGDVYGWYPIPSAASSGCNYGTWATEAKAAAQAAGVNLSVYDRIVYGFPNVSSCGWAGLASLGSGQAWLNGASGMSLRVATHELAHTYTLYHATSMSCTDGSGARVVLSGTCTVNEYGDPFDVLGAATRRHLNNTYRALRSWIPAAKALTVTTGGTYTLAAAELPSPAGYQLLRLPRPDGSSLNLELRTPYGTQFDTFAATDPAVTGVSIRLVKSGSTKSYLLDTTLATTGFSDAPLGADQTFVDPATGTRVRTVSVGPEGASVEILVGGVPPPPPDTTAPTSPAPLSAQAGATSVALSWPAAADDVGVTGYRVSRNGAVVTTTTSRSFTDTGLAPSTAYGYQVVALDAAGNASAPAQLNVTTAPADTAAPSAPANLQATVNRRKVTLAWSASSDDTSVAGYRVYRNSALVATVGATSFVDSVPRRTTSATYTVVAFDAAGNASPASSAVTVTF